MPGAVGSLYSGRGKYQRQGFAQSRMAEDPLLDMVLLLVRGMSSHVPLSSMRALSMRTEVESSS